MRSIIPVSDFRPEILGAFEIARRAGDSRRLRRGRLRVHTPLISLSKSDIIRLGRDLASTRADPSF